MLIPAQVPVVSHWCVPRLHAVPGAQSVPTAQPHCPATQARFVELLVQFAQTPLVPQAEACVPVWQVPPDAAEQQPALQGWALSHAVVQTLLTQA